MIVGEVESALSDLLSQDAVLFGQAFDRVPMVFIEPARDARNEERERI